MIQFQICKEKEKKGHKTCNNNCIQQTLEFNCEKTSKELSSKQKEERMKKSCKAKALQLIILYIDVRSRA